MTVPLPTPPRETLADFARRDSAAAWVDYTADQVRAQQVAGAQMIAEGDVAARRARLEANIVHWTGQLLLDGREAAQAAGRSPRGAEQDTGVRYRPTGFRLGKRAARRIGENAPGWIVHEAIEGPNLTSYMVGADGVVRAARVPFEFPKRQQQYHAHHAHVAHYQHDEHAEARRTGFVPDMHTEPIVRRAYKQLGRPGAYTPVRVHGEVPVVDQPLGIKYRDYDANARPYPEVRRRLARFLLGL